MQHGVLKHSHGAISHNQYYQVWQEAMKLVMVSSFTAEAIKILRTRQIGRLSSSRADSSSWNLYAVLTKAAFPYFIVPSSNSVLGTYCQNQLRMKQRNSSG